MFISVYTPTYNTPIQKFSRAYDSLCRQTHVDWEWIICDDGSDPLFLNAIKFVVRGDNRIKLIEYGHCGLIGLMKRRCTEVATGDYLVELDHDDWLSPDCLDEINKAFNENPDAGMVYSNFAEVCPDNSPHVYYGPAWSYNDVTIDGVLYKEANVPDVYGYNPAFARPYIQMWETAPNHVRAFRKDVLMELGGYNGTMKYADDYDVICRMYLNSKIVHIPKLLYFYNWGDNTCTGEANADLQIKMAEVRDKYFPYGLNIDLGCGTNKRPGFIGVDIRPLPGVDIVQDVEHDGLAYFKDNSVDHIHTADFIEHISSKTMMLNEIYRVLKPGGTCYIQVPSTDGRGAFQDPTHVSYWNENSFLDMYMNGEYRYNNKYKFSVHGLHTTKKDDRQVCWVRVTLKAIK